MWSQLQMHCQVSMPRWRLLSYVSESDDWISGYYTQHELFCIIPWCICFFSPILLHLLSSDPPSQINELEDTEVEIGSDARLKCSSSGNPRPNYIWNYYRTSNVREESEDGVSNVLIHNATAYNMGSYTCNASNGIEHVYKTVRLIVRGKLSLCLINIMCWLLLQWLNAFC